ncbi:TonB-dependent receptor domain-containing protein [Sphingobium sp. EM0848]|uniref:TonB-dependent receptor domain-containing protein n=1 Tax=Sphingobium sp. EM0848 TaxID=2743473 RepID=UPI00159C44DF|nr:TonB-dependent receptor [Sphingobium sp. EM0848]
MIAQEQGSMERRRLNRRSRLKATSAAAAILCLIDAGAARAQMAEAAAQAKGEVSVSDIVVTGSRVVREGFTAPTPTTVIGVEQIRAAAPASIADYVNQLPALVGSNTPRIANTGASATVGSNLFNLRSLGANRTLVLLDGHRVVPSTITGNVDINLLPQALVQRVDVVTGGASAAWGSDAVAGVVNFVLDRKFEGAMANIQSGIADAGDARSFKAELSYGTSFAGGRGHFILSGEYHDDDGAGKATSRDWFKGRKVIFNPGWTATNGQPRRIIRTGVGASNETSGGLITGPATVTVGGVTRPNTLRNMQFGPGGTLMPYDPGTVSGISAFGGDVEDISQAIELAVPLRYGTAYGRLSYDLTPGITVYGEANYARAWNEIVARVYDRGGNITIQRDNAFLPADVRTQMASLGLNSFQMGRMFLDWGPLRGRNRREQQRYVAGLEGRLAGGWSWDAYVQHGVTDFSTGAYANNPIVANFNRAVDAVANPANGQIVCRSTLADPTNGCVPLNIFGAGSSSQAARNYVFGRSVQDIRIQQDVAAASLRGEPFSLWAGPVSVALGVEARREKYRSTADALSLTDAFFVGNFKPSRGKYDVKEAFFETVVPLLADKSFVKSLDLNAAIRLTDYSLSGSVTTWKVGSTWDLDDQFRVRGVVSRDIRAPNLSELFQGGATLNQTVDDPVTGTSYSSRTVSQGNPDLKPERADTRSFGIVYRPAWLRGLSLSVDYFDIKIDGAIASLIAQRVIDKCQQGITAQCGFITRGSPAGPITSILLVPQNINAERTRGVDIEGTYRTELGKGDLILRAVATYVDQRSEKADGQKVDYAGTNANESQPSKAVPRWRGMASATYDLGKVASTLTGRFISAGKLNNAWVEGVDIDDNSVSSAFYLDWSMTWRIDGAAKGTEVYFAVQNLLDKGPPASPNYSTASTIQTGVNGYIYDVIGRQFRVGVRTRF